MHPSAERFSLPLILCRDVAVLYLADRSYRVSARTIEADEYALGFLPGTWPSPANLRAILEAGGVRGPWSDTTRGTIVRHWRTFFKWASRNVAVLPDGSLLPSEEWASGVLPQDAARLPNPARKLRQPRVRHRLPKVLAADQVRRIEAAIVTPIERAMFACIYGLGLRRLEAWALTPRHLSPTALRVPALGKTGERILPLTTGQAETLAKAHDGRQMWIGSSGRPLTLTGFISVMRRLRDRAGVPGLFHDLRHTYATRTLEAGANLKAVQGMLGHASPKTTDIYLHASPEWLREEHERFNPYDGTEHPRPSE